MNFFSWLVTSSVNPTKVSTTVKGALTLILPLVMAISGLTDAELGPIVDVIVQIAFLGSSIISAAMMLSGLVRKVKLGRWSAR